MAMPDLAIDALQPFIILLSMSCSTCSAEKPRSRPLFPETSGDGQFPPKEHCPQSEELLAQSLLPLVIDNILNSIVGITDEADILDQTLWSFLAGPLASERSQIRSFAYTLCCICDEICEEATASGSGGTAMMEANDGDYAQVSERHSGGSAAAANNTEPAHASGIICPLSSTTDESGGAPVGRKARAAGNDDESYPMDSEKPRQVTSQPRHVQHCHAGWVRQGPALDTLCTEDAKAERAREGSEVDVTAQGTSDSAAGTTRAVTGSSKAALSTNPLAPGRTPPPEAAIQQKQSTEGVVFSDTASKLVCSLLLAQSIIDFIDEGQEQIRRFSSLSNSLETYQALVDTLDAETVDMVHWSDGTQWLALVDAGHRERCQGPIQYALTATAFARWEKSQVQLLEHTTGVTKKAAARAISERLIGPKPEAGDVPGKTWERRRQRVATHLTRGRKWSRLVKAFGLGILFKNPWQLAKSKDSELRILIDKLGADPEKMTVLKLLSEQMESLLKSGKTNQEEFQRRLTEKGFSCPPGIPSPGNRRLDAFIRQVQESATGETLLIDGTGFKFDKCSLQRLRSSRWVNNDLILACLHLSDKLAFVRVGFSVPIHRQTDTGTVMPRPFEMAAKLISTKERGSLVWFFPLFQNQNHFSLLEVNNREESIFHYDSLGEGENIDIKTACLAEFPNFRYVEKEALRQKDGHSCGPLVVRNARLRMLGRPITGRHPDTYDPNALREDVVKVLKSAWDDGVLVVAPQTRTKKRIRNDSECDQEVQDSKRQKEVG